MTRLQFPFRKCNNTLHVVVLFLFTPSSYSTPVTYSFKSNKERKPTAPKQQHRRIENYNSSSHQIKFNVSILWRKLNPSAICTVKCLSLIYYTVTHNPLYGTVRTQVLFKLKHCNLQRLFKHPHHRLMYVFS